jgi:hypothetical protein
MDGIDHVPTAAFAPEKVEIDEFSDLLRELRDMSTLTRSEETRSVIRALVVVLQIVHESRLHIREIHARLDDMVSNTKGLIFFCILEFSQILFRS